MFNQQLRHPRRLRDANVGTLENGSKQALGRDWMIFEQTPYGSPANSNSTGTTGGRDGTYDHVPNVSGTHFLEKAKQRGNASTSPSMNTALAPEYSLYPADVPGGIEPNQARHNRQQHLIRTRNSRDPPLPFSSADGLMSSLAITSKQPMCKPASIVTGAPASSVRRWSGANALAKSMRQTGNGISGDIDHRYVELIVPPPVQVM